MSRNMYTTKVSKKFSPFLMFEADHVARGCQIFLQNMLLKQVNFPSDIRKSEYCAEFWMDQLVPEQWVRALAKIVSKARDPERWFWDSTDDSFLAMAQYLVGRKFKVTGAIVVRYTDVNTQKPRLKIMAVGVKIPRTVYCGNQGPHVVRDLRGVEQGCRATYPC